MPETSGFLSVKYPAGVAVSWGPVYPGISDGFESDRWWDRRGGLEFEKEGHGVVPVGRELDLMIVYSCTGRRGGCMEEEEINARALGRVALAVP